MESRFLFFVPDPVFQSNSPYLKGIERLDILTLNNEPLLFLIHNGEARHQVWVLGARDSPEPSRAA